MPLTHPNPNPNLKRWPFNLKVIVCLWPSMDYICTDFGVDSWSRSFKSTDSQTQIIKQTYVQSLNELKAVISLTRRNSDRFEMVRAVCRADTDGISTVHSAHCSVVANVTETWTLVFCQRSSHIRLFHGHSFLSRQVRVGLRIPGRNLSAGRDGAARGESVWIRTDASLLPH